MVNYVQKSANYFQKVYANGEVRRVSREEYEQKGGKKYEKSHKIHAYWKNQKIPMMMKPVLVIKMKKKINEGECAEKIAKKFNLTELPMMTNNTLWANTNNNNNNNQFVNPVWIQKIKGHYIIFIALEEKNENFKKYGSILKMDCFKGGINVTDKYRYKIHELVKNKNATANYTNLLGNMFENNNSSTKNKKSVTRKPIKDKSTKSVKKPNTRRATLQDKTNIEAMIGLVPPVNQA